LCKKSFSDQTTLRRHSTVHTLEKPYNCSSCDKSFSRSEHLRKHIKVHTMKNLP
jgi:KRAB domain-containing zinc finger protein